VITAIDTTGALDSGLTELFEFPFFEGRGGVSSEVPYLWPISLGGRPFVVDLEHYQWSLPDMVRQAIDFSASPGEQSFDTGGVWMRSNGDWSLGAGQEYHDADGANQRIFAESRGIDPWTKRQIALLPDTDLMLGVPTSTMLRLLPFGSWLYMMDGTNRTLERTDEPQAHVPTFVGITGMPATALNDICTDGGLIYVAGAAGIYKHDPSGTTATAYGGAASTTAATLLRYANGWLICGVGNQLKSIDTAGALTVITTHRVTAFRWTALVGAPSGIYAAGQGTDVAEIVHIGFDDATGGLSVPVHAGELPRGESISTLAYYGSVLLIGTNKGFRIAQINGDVNASLDIGPLIATPSPVLKAFGDSKFVYFGWTNYDATHTGVARANLAEFRSRQQPAYASDIMATAQGAVQDVCRFADRTYFAISGSGFWREHYLGNLCETGTIRLGKTEWGTFEPKTFLGVQLITLPLVGTVHVDVTDDAGNVTALGTLASPGTTGLGELIGGGLGSLSTFYDLTLTLNRNPAALTTGPTVRLVTARSLVVPHQVQRWVLPIICKEKVLVGPGEEVEEVQDVLAIRDYFVNLRQKGTPIIFQEGDSRRTVVVRDVAFPDGSVTRWGIGRNGLQGLLFVTLDSTEN
jgi:hypothetical protein